jgi:hypothetical protein
MRPIPNTLVTLVGVALALSAARAASWHVDNRTGDDANDGSSPASAVRSIAKAISLCRTSDTLVLANTGVPYRENIVMKALGGTPEKPFVIEGNGAVISGFKSMPAEQWRKQPDDTWLFACTPPVMRPYLMSREEKLAPAQDPGSLAVEQYLWAKEGVYFMPAPGKAIGDYDLRATMLESGLQIWSSNYIRCRNLISEGFSNDGFNIHGECQGIYC